MEKEKKPTLVERLLGSRRHSVNITSRTSKAEEKKSEPEKPALLRGSTGPARTRPRSGTAPTTRVSASVPPADKKEDEVEKPTCVEELPRSLQHYLADSDVGRDVLNAHFEVTLLALRLTAKKEHRRHAFFQAQDKGAAEGEEAPEIDPATVFQEVKTEKELRKTYRVGEQIGKGAFGAVYEGRHGGTQVALKKIGNMGKRQAQRNAREAFFLTQCDHEKILKVLSCHHAADTNTVWLVMELIEGGSLDEGLRLSGALPEREAARVCSDLLEAVAYLHARKWAHRDIKPANAMLALQHSRRRAVVKLVDFSLATDVSKVPEVHALGTQAWMPPEMVLRQPHSLPCDIWSLGVTALALLQNHTGFRSGFDALFVPAATGVAPALRSPELFSGDARAFVAAACTVDAAARPTAAELLRHPFVASAATPEEMWRLVKTIFRHSAISSVVGQF